MRVGKAEGGVKGSGGGGGGGALFSVHSLDGERGRGAGTVMQWSIMRLRECRSCISFA